MKKAKVLYFFLVVGFLFNYNALHCNYDCNCSHTCDYPSSSYRRIRLYSSGNSANLKHIYFSNKNFERVEFRHASLSYSTFDSCNLRHANFYNTSFLGTVFKNCDLTGATFNGASIGEGTMFDGSTLKNANFDGAKDLSNRQRQYLRDNGAINVSDDLLEYEDLINRISNRGGYSYLIKVKEAVLNECDFSNRKLRNLLFLDSNLNNVNFEKSKFTRAIFRKTNLRKANFKQARFYDVTFEDVVIRGADFQGALGLTDEQKKYLRRKRAVNVPKDGEGEIPLSYYRKMTGFVGMAFKTPSRFYKYLKKLRSKGSEKSK